jgi:uncharacterized protein (DUF1330 family)
MLLHTRSFVRYFRNDTNELESRRPFDSGRYLARGTAAAAYETGQKQRIVISEFPSIEKATAAYASAAYQEARAPPAPLPNGIWSVSPSMRRMSSIGIPRAIAESIYRAAVASADVVASPKTERAHGDPLPGRTPTGWLGMSDSNRRIRPQTAAESFLAWAEELDLLLAPPETAQRHD